MSILSILAPYKIAAEVAVFGAVAIGGAWGVHTVLERARETGRNEVRGEWKAADVARIEAEQKIAAAQTVTRDLAVMQGEARDKTINAAVAASAAAVVSLRGTVASQQAQLATASVETARKYSAVAGAVFTECADRYRSVAAEAERNASAARTLNDAWPVVEKKPAN